MSNLNKFFCLIVALLFMGSGLKAQMDVAPTNGLTPKKQVIQNKRLLPLDFTFNLADSILAYDPMMAGNGNAGVIYFNGEFWVSKWASDEIVILDSLGSVDTIISITGLTGVRSFTTDGVSIFAGDASSNIYAINPTTWALDSTIALPSTSVGSRMTAYDPNADNGNGGFWIANFTSDIELYSRTGVLLQTIPQSTHGVSSIYGGAVDTITPGGPYLAIYNQGVASESRIDYVEISTGLPAGFIYNTNMDLSFTQVNNPNPAIAGGLFISDSYNPSHQVIMGVLQGSPDILFGYENLVYNCPQSTNLFANPINATDVELSWTPGGGTNWKIEYGPEGFTPGTGTIFQTSSTIDTITGLTTGITYDFYIEDSCSVGQLSFWSGPATAMLGYCIPAYSTGCTFGDDINSFELYGVNSTSITDLNTGCALNAYDDKTTLPAVDLVAGMTHHGSITSSYGFPSEFAKIWIDFDNDGQFQDATDLVGTVGPFSTTAVPFSISIPSTINAGLHRMRVRAVYNGTTYSFDACSSFTWGEAHDYTVNLIIPNCPVPLSLDAQNITTNSADLSWIEGGISTQWYVEYGPMGFTPGNGSDTITTSNPVNISGLAPNTQYEFYVSAICGQNDTSYAVGPFRFLTPCLPNATFPFSENFDGNVVNGVWDCWTVLNFDGGNTWVQDNIFLTPHSGAYVAHGMGNNNDMLITPELTMPSTPMWLKVWDIVENASFSNTYSILVSTTGKDSADFTDTLATFNVTNDVWVERTVSLAAYANQNIHVALWQSFSGSTGWGFGVDDFLIEEIPSCFKPLNLSVSDVTIDSALVTWVDTTLATQWEIEFGPSGYSVGNGTSLLTSTIPTKIGGLSPNTLYDVYIRTVCGRNDSSKWVGPIQFITPCVAVTTYPYTEDFDGTTTLDVWNCWKVLDFDGGNTWRQDNAWITARSAPFTAYGMGNNNDMLISPQFSLPSTPMWVRLWDIVESSTQNNTYSVLVSTTGNDSADFTDTLATFNVTNDVWTERSIDLSAYANQDIYIALWQSFSSSTFMAFGIDDFVVEELPSCFKPSSIHTINLASTSTDIGWTENNLATEWVVEYGTTGFGLGNGIRDTVVTNPITITGLLPNTTYEFYVMSVCGRNDSSTWAGPFVFETPCSAVISYPYQQSYNSFTPICWTVADNGTPATGPSNFGFSSWYQDDYLNNASNDRAATINLYSNFVEDWLISEPFDLSGAGSQPYELRMEVGLTQWQNTTSGNLGSDDQVQVLISTDGGATWVNLYTWDVNSQISNTGDVVSIPLGAYTGTNNIFAIWGTDGISNDPEDNEFFIDEFIVRVVPTCIDPSSVTAINVSTDSALIGWTENNTATQWVVEYGPAGFTPGNGTMDTTTSNPYQISGLLPSSNYEFYVQSICSPSDLSPWTGPFPFTTMCDTISHYPYKENFSIYVPLCWEEADDGTPATGPMNFGNSSWNQDDYLNNAANGKGISINLFSNFMEDWLITEPFDLSGAAQPYELRMKVGMTQWANTTPGTLGSDDEIQLLISTNGGASWNNLYTWDATSVISNTGSIITIPLNAYTGNNNIFAFWGTDGSVIDPADNEFFVDDFEIRTTPNCLEPTNLNASLITKDSATLSWTEVNFTTVWLVEYGPAGFLPGTGTDTVVNSNPYVLSGLTPGTSYDFYVKSICGRGDTSYYTGPYTFSTPCLAVASFPYNENFDGSLTDNVWDCWYVRNFDGGDTWRQDNIFLTPHSGAFVAHGMGNNNDMLISPQFDLPATPMWLKLWDIVESSNMNNIYSVLVSTTGRDSADFTDTLATYDVTNDVWVERTIDLSAYANQSIYIALWQSYSASNFWGFGVDDFKIEQMPSCLEPSNFDLIYLNQDSVEFGWTENNSATEWIIQYGTSGFNLGSGTIDTVNSIPMSISGLNSQTTYEVYIKSICSTSDISTWAGPFSFTTLCTPNTAFPYNQNFSSYVPICWEIADNGNPTSGATDFGSSAWFQNDYLNIINNGDAATINLYSDFNEDWIISEPFDLSTGSLPYQLTIDVGVTEFAGTGPENMGSDDQVQVLISTDGGANWNILHTWDVNNQPTNVGTTEIISLSGYTGSNNVFAIWATDGTVDDFEDFDFHVTNFNIDIVSGIENETEAVSTITIQPNPSSGIFHIVGEKVNEPVEIAVYNTNGKLVYRSTEKFSNNFNERIDVSDLAKGLYFIKLQSKTSMEMKKIVIQ